MSEGKLPTREDLRLALRRYDYAINDENVPEREVNRALLELTTLVPHAFISDLLHYGEVERTDDEVIEEALLRERLWQEGGDVSLYSHMEAQLSAALADPSITCHHKSYCEKMFEHIREHMSHVRH